MRELLFLASILISFITRILITVLKFPVQLLSILPTLVGISVTQPDGIFSKWQITSMWETLNEELDKED